MASTNVQAFSGDVEIRGTTFIKANTNTDNLAIGTQAGETSQGNNTVAIGTEAGKTSQGNNAVAVGHDAGLTNQGAQATALGYGAGSTGQGLYTVAVGRDAGNTSQGEEAIAVGYDAGNTSQGSRSVAIGKLAGSTGQGADAVAIGRDAATTDQAYGSVAVGFDAARTSQGNSAVAVGRSAGQTDQGSFGVALGYLAGQTSQGENAIAIGERAGLNNQGDNSIVINATGSEFSPTTASSFHVKPVRGGDFAASALAYTSAGEIVEETDTHFDANGNVGVGTASPSMQLEVKGTGQTATGTFNQSGSVGGTIGLRDSGTSPGNGGAIMFGAEQGYWCAIKGNIVDGGGNTTGSLSFYTRGATGDSTMTRRMVINTDGTINSTGGIDNINMGQDATDASRRVLFTTGNTGALPVKTDGGLVYNPSNNILTTTVTTAQTANKLYSGSIDGTDANYYIPFRSGHNNSSADFYTDQNLYYNPANNTLNVIANGANSATYATNAGSANMLLTNSVDTTNTNYYVPFRVGHNDVTKAFHTDSNFYYNPANNFINANAPFANAATNATYANSASFANAATNATYANSAGSAYSTNGGFINGGNHRANILYHLRQGGYNHYIQSSTNTMFLKGYGDVAEYGSVNVLCGSGRGNSYTACEFFNKSTNINGVGGIRVTGPCRADSFPGNSDDRIKYNETSLSNCLSTINALRPLSYEKLISSGEYGTWIPTNEEWETDKANGKDWIYERGFIAQQIKEIPELAFTVGGEEIVNKEKTISVEEYDLLSSNLQIGYTPIHMYLRQIIITNAEYKELDIDESQNYSIHELEGYVSGDVTKTIEEFEQLTNEEQSGYRPIYNYTRNERIEVDEYNALDSEGRAQYSNTLMGYSKVIPTQVPLTVNYNSIFTTAVGAIQELNEKVNALETRVTTLEGN